MSIWIKLLEVEILLSGKFSFQVNLLSGKFSFQVNSSLKQQFSLFSLLFIKSLEIIYDCKKINEALKIIYHIKHFNESQYVTRIEISIP